MTDLITIDLDAERNEVDRLRLQWVEEVTKLERTVSQSAANKNTPGHGYWEAERRAWLKYEAARNFLEALELTRN